MKSPVFIVGPHRSGSTLWHNLIAMAPGVMRLTDPRFLGRGRQTDFRHFLKRYAGDLSNDQNVDRMVNLCFSRTAVPGLDSTFWRFENIEVANDPELQRTIAQRIKASDRSLGSIARVFIEEITRFSGCTQACVKFPVDVRHAPRLREWFPECKIVHIIRDPRALAISKSNDPSGTAITVAKHPHLRWPIRKAALWLVVIQYRASAKLHKQLRRVSNYRLFRYEDLLSDPPKVLRELCDFIGVEFSKSMLNPEKGQHEHQPSSVTGKRQKAFDPQAVNRWRTVISPIDHLIICSLCHFSMKQLGYVPELPGLSGRALKPSQPVASSPVVWSERTQAEK